ncbi:MAG TPA: MATE family efflux transporter [Clostridia bacterium]|nr:MATE family efflux transporter [Clostridia bacterium]
MKIRARNIDLTQGAIVKTLLLFFLPIFLGGLFQQLYTMADAVVIGQFAGKQGLAAIDSVYNLIKLPINFFMGLSTGATILISQYFGRRSEEELNKTVHTAVAFALAGGLLLSAAGVVFAPQFLRLLKVPEDIFATALSYVRIYFGGLSVSMLYNVGAGILRAVGDSKTPLFVLIISSVVNTATDLLFVGLFRWGAGGAALSTVLAQLVSAALVIRALIKTPLGCRLIPSHIKIHAPILRSILKVGLPIGLQASLYPIANMIIQSNINRMGTDSIAAWALCGKLDFFLWVAIDALATAVSTFAAQNYGANLIARVRKGLRAGLIMTLLVVFVLSAALYFWSEPLGKLFIKSEDYGILPLVGKLMRFLAPLYFLYVFGELLAGGIRATGESFMPMLITLFGTWACKILWVLFVVPQDRSLFTVVASYPVSWLITSTLFAVYYAFFRRKKLRAG